MKNDDSQWGVVRLKGSAFLWLSLAIAVMGLSIPTAVAKSPAGQFVVEDFDGAVWNSRDGGSALSSEHSATNGWILAW
jgi:hypothetical protein